MKQWLTERWGRLDTWARLVCAMVLLRFTGGIFHAANPITMPHTWRQVDTMGIALRYALRWSVEPEEGIFWWMPAVLNSGDTRGIMAMEFPLLNLFGGIAFFAAGGDIDLGRRLAQASFLLLVTLLAGVCVFAWRRLPDAPKGMTFVILGGAVASFAAPFVTKFMPDLPAMLLSLTGVAGIWGLQVFAIIPLSLGLLMKPTSGVVVVFLLLHPSIKKVWFKQGLILAAALITPAYWYFHIMPYLKSLQERAQLFTIHDKIDPWHRLVEFWTSPAIWDLLHFHGVFSFAWIVAAWGLFKVWRKPVGGSIKLAILGVLVAGSIVGAMSGDHAGLHSYYLIGLAPIVIFLIARMWEEVPSKVFRGIIAAGLLVRSGEYMLADARGLWDDRQGAAWFAECADLKKQFPAAPWRQNKIWRTPVEQFPLLDLCLGERGQSSKGVWGLFRKEVRKESMIPSDCHIEGQSKRLSLVKCGDQSW
ncbi:MAG: hypothetical protein NTV34_10545 [Proteobacteria bacterium]|nr:hypothetical protein [Pseudomonadota bacterium]